MLLNQTKAFNVSVTAQPGFSSEVVITHSEPAELLVTPESASSSYLNYPSVSFSVKPSVIGTHLITITGTGGGYTQSITVAVFVPTPSNTGFRNPTAQTTNNSQGDGNGFEVRPTAAFLNNGSTLGFAVDTNSGSGTGSACDSENKDSHQYYGYGNALPSTALVTGIEVRLDAKVDSIVGAPKMCVELSWNGGSTWTDYQFTPTLSTGEVTYILGGMGDTWDRVWTPANLNGGFRIRITNVSSASTTDFYLDWVSVRVHYYSNPALISSMSLTFGMLPTLVAMVARALIGDGRRRRRARMMWPTYS